MDCKHEHLEHCGQCDTVKCKDCGKMWPTQTIVYPSVPTYPMPFYPTYPKFPTGPYWSFPTLPYIQCSGHQS